MRGVYLGEGDGEGAWIDRVCAGGKGGRTVDGEERRVVCEQLEQKAE